MMSFLRLRLFAISTLMTVLHMSEASAVALRPDDRPAITFAIDAAGPDVIPIPGLAS